MHMKPPLSTAAPSHQMVLLEIISGYREIIKVPKPHIQIRMGHIILLPPVLGEIIGEIRLGGFLLMWHVSSPATPSTTATGVGSEGLHLRLNN